MAIPPVSPIATPPRRPFPRKFHPARLVYRSAIAAVTGSGIIGILFTAVQAIAKGGLGAVFDLNRLRETTIGRFVVANPLIAGLVAVVAVVVVVWGWREDQQHIAEEKEKEREEFRGIAREEINVRGVPLTLAKDLKRVSFNLGDDTAANIPFQIAPIQQQYDKATQALHEAATGNPGAKRGILVVGAARAGKTRLAFETLVKTLPKWHVLRWQEGYSTEQIPTDDTLRGRDLVVFLDDLQDYVPYEPAQNFVVYGTGSNLGIDATAQKTLVGILDRQAGVSTSAKKLQTMLQRVRGSGARKVVVVATCRSEDAERVQPSLGWLFGELENIRVPTFSPNPNEQVAAAVIAAFAANHAQHLAEWDGNMGSLVLGLSAKRDEYLQIQREPAGALLRAMKLLSLEGTTLHTELRIRSVCAAVFAESALRDDDRTWRNAKADLIRMQFVRTGEVGSAGEAPPLVIRNDSYFTYVITNYPPPDDLSQLVEDRTKLQRVFIDIKDVEGLFNLGVARLLLSDYQLDWARAQPDPTHSTDFALSNQINAMHRQEALSAFDAVVQLDPDHIEAWYDKGLVLDYLGRYDQALESFDRALHLDPTYIEALNGKALALGRVYRAAEALRILEQVLNSSLSTRSSAAMAAVNLGYILVQQDDPAHARTAYQLAMDSGVPNAVTLAGLSLMRLLNQQGDANGAQAVYERIRASGSINPLEASVAISDNEAHAVDLVRQRLVASDVFTLGTPAGDVTADGRAGTESDLLHFTIDGPDGKTQVIMPVFTRVDLLPDALRRNPEWLPLMVLQVNGNSLLTNIDDEVHMVIDPWSPLEFRFPERSSLNI